ncbi:MAG: mechanosensitive ion channel [Ignavibacteriae bacterium]|nr:mechanosensitive ion channel [Ignavibacteriota bacterium]MCB0749444.1 mechanosensitive ion channel [Ignavibacteriota bacterium]
MKEFENWFDIIIFSAQNILFQVLDFIPKLLIVVFLLLIGWLVAKILQKLSNKIFDLIGVNNISSKAGIENFLVSSGFASNISYLFSKIIFWTVLILFLIPISDILNLKFFVNIIDQVINYLPNLFVALFILLLGAWGAKITGGIVRGSSKRLGLENAELLGTIFNVLILVIAFIIALTQLKIEAEILTNILLILLGSLGIAFSISFGLGAKDVFKNIIAGVYLHKSIRDGEFVKFGNIEGEIIEIGTILTKIKINENKEISIPNNQLIETVIN